VRLWDRTTGKAEVFPPMRLGYPLALVSAGGGRAVVVGNQGAAAELSFGRDSRPSVRPAALFPPPMIEPRFRHGIPPMLTHAALMPGGRGVVVREQQGQVLALPRGRAEVVRLHPRERTAGWARREGEARGLTLSRSGRLVAFRSAAGIVLAETGTGERV